MGRSGARWPVAALGEVQWSTLPPVSDGLAGDSRAAVTSAAWTDSSCSGPVAVDAHAEVDLGDRAARALGEVDEHRDLDAPALDERDLLRGRPAPANSPDNGWCSPVSSGESDSSGRATSSVVRPPPPGGSDARSTP